MHLVQFELSNGERRVGVVDNGQVREVEDARSVRDLALAAIEAGSSSTVNCSRRLSRLNSSAKRPTCRASECSSSSVRLRCSASASR